MGNDTLQSIMDRLSSIFGGNSQAKTPPSPPATVQDAAGKLSADLEITRQEAEELLRKCGISPSAASLTQEETAAVYKAHYSAAVEDDGLKPGDRKPPQPAVKTAGEARKDPVKIPPSEIIADFSRNFEEARRKYAGVKTAFTGTVELVRRDGENNFAVEMTSDDPAFHGKLVCRFVESMKPRLDKLELGQKAAMAGWISGTDGIILQGGGTITIGNTVILPSLPAPAGIIVDPGPKTPKPPVKIPPSEIIADFSRNFEEARQKYAGVKTAFTGTVDLVRRDGGRNFAVEMTSDDPAFHGKIVGRFVESMKPRLDALGIGQGITMAGWISGTDGIILDYNNDTITIGNTVILPSLPAPAGIIVDPGPKTTKDPVNIPPSVIIRDYSADFESARQKYSGKRLAFTGAVELVRKDGENNFAVEIVPGDPDFSGKVICRFVNNMKPRLQKLRKGQQATISGYMSGGADGLSLAPDSQAITVSNSVIVSEAPAPKVPHRVRIFPMTDIPETIISRSSVPAEGSTVITESGKEYILGDAVGHGGEGAVYRVNASGLVAKIYDESHCTERRREKIRQMSESRLNFGDICFPRETLYTKAGEFTGYTMKEAKGHDFAYLWREKEVFDKRFPDWKKADLVKLAVTILRNIKYLHDHDVLIGDINPLNILFVSPDEVYFLDTDSYQFRGFPAPVGTDKFTAPELQGVDLRTVMRTQGSEDFSVAMFLFMLMTQGASPYAYQGGSSPAHNIRHGLFPFGVGSKKVSNVWDVQPQGSVRFQWSHLMRALKEAFWDTFHADGEHRDADKRYTADEWYYLMRRYEKSLPAMTQEDPQSGEVFPNRLKRSSQVSYRTCEHCGEEKPEELFADDTTCQACFSRIREERNKARNEVYMTLVCQDCGEEFTITRGEHEFYTSKGLELPKRCPRCREAKKNSGGWDL